MNLSEYETTLVVRPDIGGDAIEATLDRVREAVRSRGGKLLAINHWGRKKLAYAIDKHTRGVYVHTQYLGGGELVSEIERNLRISDNVLRFLTVRLANDVDPASKEEKAYVAPQYDLEAQAEEAEEQRAAAGDLDDGRHGDIDADHADHADHGEPTAEADEPAGSDKEEQS